MNTLAQLQSSDFRAHLNSMFSVRLDEMEPIELELVKMVEAGPKFKPEARQPFSLYFLGPVSSRYLLQHTYHLEHPQMGEIDLFLVPLGLEAGRMRYEAVLT